MSDLSYRLVKMVGTPIFWSSSKPVILHVERAAMEGGYILAGNHLSYFDAPVLIRHTPRQIDFMAIDESRKHPTVRRLIEWCNSFYVSRDRRDLGAMREALRRLKRGRVVGIFPEGGVRDSAHSVLRGGPLRLDIARLAEIANVPILPSVILGTAQYLRVANWLPLGKTHYGIIYGQPIRTNGQTPEAVIRNLSQVYSSLCQELLAKMRWREFDRRN